MEAPGQSSPCSELYLCNGEERAMSSFFNSVLKVKWSSDLTKPIKEFKFNLAKFQTRIKVSNKIKKDDTYI